MKQFDFTTDRFKLHCTAKQKLLLGTHAQPITQERYITLVQAMPKHAKWSHGHSPSYAAAEYQDLVNNFGFFPGGQPTKGDE